MRLPQRMSLGSLGEATFVLSVGQVVDGPGLDLFGWFEAEDPAVELELSLEGGLDAWGAPEAVQLSLERRVGDRQALVEDGVRHALGRPAGACCRRSSGAAQLRSRASSCGRPRSRSRSREGSAHGERASGLEPSAPRHRRRRPTQSPGLKRSLTWSLRRHRDDAQRDWGRS